MKKLTISLLPLLVMTLTGCEKPTEAQIDHYMANRAIGFDYKGHHYIMFRDGGNNNSVGGVVHGPNCRCQESSTQSLYTAKKGEEQ